MPPAAVPCKPYVGGPDSLEGVLKSVQENTGRPEGWGRPGWETWQGCPKPLPTGHVCSGWPPSAALTLWVRVTGGQIELRCEQA